MAPELPEHGAARSTDPETSHQAAASVDLGILYGLIVDALAVRPMTSEAIAIHINRARDSVSPRMRDMERAGLLVDSGKKAPNPTSGRSAIVWRLPTDEEKQMQLLLEVRPATDKQEMKRRAAAFTRMLSCDDPHVRMIAERFLQE